MMKMTDAEKHTNITALKQGHENKMFNTKRTLNTYDSEDERVGEVSVERELHHVPPEAQQLHRLSQAHKDVTTRSRNFTERTTETCSATFTSHAGQFKTLSHSANIHSLPPCTGRNPRADAPVGFSLCRSRFEFSWCFRVTLMFKDTSDSRVHVSVSSG